MTGIALPSPLRRRRRARRDVARPADVTHPFGLPDALLVVFLLRTLFSKDTLGSFYPLVDAIGDMGLPLIALVLIGLRPRAAVTFALAWWPMIMLMGWFLATAVLSWMPALGFERWAFFVANLLVAVACAISIDSPGRAHRNFAIAFAILAVINLLFWLSNPLYGTDARGGFGGTVEEKNTAGQMFLVGAIVLGTYAARTSRSFLRLALLGLSALSAFLLVMTISKTSIGLGAIGIVYSLLIAKFVRSSMAAALPLKVVAITAVGLSALSLYLAIGLTPLRADDEALSLTNRTTIWNAVLHKISLEPVFGHGFGTFWINGRETNGFGETMYLSWQDEWIDEAEVINQGHNGYLDIMLSTGIPGLVLALFVVGRSMRRVERLMSSGLLSRADRSAFLMFHALLVAVLLNNLLETSLFYAPPLIMGLFAYASMAQIDRWWVARPADLR